MFGFSIDRALHQHRPRSVRFGRNCALGLSTALGRRPSGGTQGLFTISNRSVYGLGKWYAKFRTVKFSSGIAFTICTDQFHLTENGREGLKLVSKMALRKWKTNFRWNILSGKTGLPFQMFRCSRKFSVGKTQKVVFHLLSNRISRKILVNGKQPRPRAQFLPIRTSQPVNNIYLLRKFGI